MTVSSKTFKTASKIAARNWRKGSAAMEKAIRIQFPSLDNAAVGTIFTNALMAMSDEQIAHIEYVDAHTA